VLPAIAYPEELPVSARRADIAAAIAAHQVVVVAGETGSGKTTQLPKILLDLGRGRAGQIGHTQPRRIAARSVAERIAFELGVPLGGAVGYQVRFTDESADETLVKVMTDGVLLAQIQRDPMLRRYDTLIIDEAHERSLNIDFLLGYLTRLLPRRPDLKLIITSATIDSARFAAHYAGADGKPAPVVEVTGRTYPVEIRYRPLGPEPAQAADDEVGPPSSGTGRSSGAGRSSGTGKRTTKAGAAAEPKDLDTAIVEAVGELMAEGPGDVLVFLSGEREIRDAADALHGAFGPRLDDPRRPDALELLPLYARLSSAEQRRVFEAHAARRIVLATNVAETSLTVPGVRYVIDAGTARISRYSKATKVQRLPIEPISQASANQRSGRSGRLAPGVAIRLYADDDFAARPRYTEPEILRTSLASVILQMVAVGVVSSPDEVAEFPFVDRPDVRAVRDGVTLLTELGALTTAPVPSSARHIGTSAPRRQIDAPNRGRNTEVAGPDAAAGVGPAGDSATGTTSGRVRLTDVGRALAQLPIDPRQARMVVEAGRRGVAREVVVIAAALSIQDPRERPADQREQADALHARFADPSSDLLTYLNLWTWLRRRQKELSGSAFRRLLRAEHLNYLRIREWQDVVTQLRDLTKPLGIDAKGAPRALDDDHTARPAAAGDRVEKSAVRAGKSTRTGGDDAPTGEAVPLRHVAPGAAATSSAPLRRVAPGAVATSSGPADEPVPDEAVRTRWAWDADPIHQALLSGLISQVGMQLATEVAAAPRRANAPGRPPRPRNEYLGARGAKFAIFPGSPIARRPPSWLMAAELVETSRLWARGVARIRPEWVEEQAAHLVRRTYADPGWSPRQGAATVTEKVLLYGIPLVAGRRVLLAKVDPVQARELFVRHALVQGEWTTHHQFFDANRRLLEEAQGLEARARRRDLVVDDDALFDFYDERVPDEVVSARHFDTWWKGARRADPDLLTFTREVLLRPGAAAIDSHAFPERWPAGDASLPVTYQFEPGTEADGVTVHVPLVVLPRLRPEGFDWMVPGLRAELIQATIRTLPKPVRVQLVPAPDVARAVAGWMEQHLASWEDTVRAADAAPSFHEAFATAVRALRDVDVPADAFDDERLPAHLRATFRIIDAGGVIVDEGKDLLALQRRLVARSDEAVSTAVRTAVRAAMEEARTASDAAARGARGADGADVTPQGAHASQEHHVRRDGTSASAPRLTAEMPATSPASAGAADQASTGPHAAPRGSAQGTDGADGSGPAHDERTLPDLERDGLTTWPDDLVLPPVVETSARGVVVRAYPALVDLATAVTSAASDGRARGSGTPGAGAPSRSTPAAPQGGARGPVGVRVLGSPAAAEAAHRAGLRRLLLADVGLGTARVTTRWNGAQALALASSPYPSTEALVSDVQLAAIDALVPDPSAVRDRAAYDVVRAALRDGLEDEVHRLIGALVDVLTAWREADAAVRSSSSLALVAAARDVRAQLAGLVGPGFVARTGATRLPTLTRYLRAATYRLGKAAEDPHRDAALEAQVREASQAYDEAVTRAAASAPDAARAAALDTVRWQLEELRVSLFAQHLGTPERVSTTRIHRALAGV
jgi:ATP-dependent helicase HrpA